MSLLSTLLVVLAFSGLLIWLVAAAYRWPSWRSRRIVEDRNRKVGGVEHQWRVFGNMALSGVLVVVATHLLGSWLVSPQRPSWWGGVGQTLAILLIYDFFYYLMHRFAFHGWAVMRPIHVIHHKVRHPTALDSLYLHPIENVLGLSLLLVCVMLVGPVHVVTFGVVFGVYSSMNILVHAGLRLPFFPFRALTFLAVKHDIHHTSMRGGNFASLTPLFDHLFGTAE